MLDRLNKPLVMPKPKEARAFPEEHMITTPRLPTTHSSEQGFLVQIEMQRTTRALYNTSTPERIMPSSEGVHMNQQLAKQVAN